MTSLQARRVRSPAKISTKVHEVAKAVKVKVTQPFRMPRGSRDSGLGRLSEESTRQLKIIFVPKTLKTQ